MHFILAFAIEELLTGRVLQAADISAQRIKAVEQAASLGGWDAARHIEIVPGPDVNMMTFEEHAHVHRQFRAEARVQDWDGATY